MSRDPAEILRRLRATFVQEAIEQCASISGALLELEQAPPETRSALIDTMFRCAHSLKGAARAVNHAPVEAICQRMESVFDAWKRGTLAPTPEAFDVLHRGVEHLRRLAPAEPSGGTKEIGTMIGELEILSRPGVAPPSRPAARPPPNPPPAAAPADSSLAPETIRIDLGKIDRTLYATEELLSFKAALAQRTSELREVASWFGETRRAALAAGAAGAGASGQIPAELASRSFEAEQKLSALAVAWERDRLTFGKNVEYLLQETKQLLLHPFSTDESFYAKLVRDLAREQGKQVQFRFQGGEVELDKRILEGIKPPLIHLLRNAVDHGIELPEIRRAAGKPERGGVVLSANRVSDRKVEIVVEDDGGGIDLRRLRETVARSPRQIDGPVDALSDAELLEYIFRPEVTTAPTVTEVSGRGLGLAIVQDSVKALNGRVTVESQPGRGVAFRLMLPVARNAYGGLLVAVGDQIFVLPAMQVHRVLRVQPEEISTVGNRPTVAVEGRPVAFAWLAETLALPPAPRSASAHWLTVVILGRADRRIAFAVDAVLGDEDVLVKPLRKPLLRVRNIAGATVLASGRPALILDPADLIDSAVAGVRATAAPTAAAEKTAPQRCILVVEDSITSRMLLKNILEAAGHVVRTAVDGIDALTVLRSERIDLVVSDVEMPRLDGFGLAAAMRADRRWAETPLVLVTALATPAHRERGMEVGANAYIVKSDFDESDLLETVARFL